MLFRAIISAARRETIAAKIEAVCQRGASRRTLPVNIQKASAPAAMSPRKNDTMENKITPTLPLQHLLSVG
jgi:hypothetical protein